MLVQFRQSFRLDCPRWQEHSRMPLLVVPTKVALLCLTEGACYGEVLADFSTLASGLPISDAVPATCRRLIERSAGKVSSATERTIHTQTLHRLKMTFCPQK